jgi:aminoglycoside 6'-N-acetyltransferase
VNLCALILIDVQVNMFEPVPVWSAETVVANLSLLLERARAANVFTLFVRNCGRAGDPDVPGMQGWELHPAFRPSSDELVLDKTTCDTFASTGLEHELKARQITQLVLAGFQSEFCITETAAGALARGYKVTLVMDGHSTYDGKFETAPQKVAKVNADFAGRAALGLAREIHFNE